MTLFEIPLTNTSSTLPADVRVWLELAQARVQRYWDQFPTKPLPQYVECDFEFVARALLDCEQSGLIDGRMFVEWGCGFGVVTGVAAALGFEAVGIEAEEFLCQEGQALLASANLSGEIWHGNFLPHGARNLAEADDPLVSLTHDAEPAYPAHDCSVQDFAIIFAYPWPGEEHFLKLVFDRFARSGALLLLFRGPFQIELYRKK